MSSALRIVGPGGGVVATYATIAAALVAARASGGTVSLVAGTYDENLSLQDGDRLAAAGPGVLVRGAHTVTLSSADGAVELAGIALEYAGTGGEPTLAVGGDAPNGRVTLRDCSVKVPSGGGASVPIESLSSAKLKLVRCLVSPDPTGTGVPAISSLGGGALSIAGGAYDAGGDAAYPAIHHVATPAAQVEAFGATLRGSLAIDDSDTSLAADAVVARLDLTAIHTTGGMAAVQSDGGTVPTHRIELGAGALLDAPGGVAIAGLTAYRVADVATGLSTKPVGTREETATFVARAVVMLNYGPGFTAIPAGGIVLTGPLDVAVIDTSGSALPVAVRLPPLADTPDGHVVELKNLGTIMDLIASASGSDEIDGTASAFINVNGKGVARLRACRARSSWLLA